VRTARDSCRACAGTAAEVVVVADPGAVKGRARAEVDVGKMFVSSP
jgi:hypothetical protein